MVAETVRGPEAKETPEKPTDEEPNAERLTAALTDSHPSGLRADGPTSVIYVWRRCESRRDRTTVGTSSVVSASFTGRTSTTSVPFVVSSSLESYVSARSSKL